MSTEPVPPRGERAFVAILLFPLRAIERARGWRRLGLLLLYVLIALPILAQSVPLFTREMGRPPASSAEALRRYLPIPGDTPDRDEAEPILEGAGAGPPR